MAGLMASSPELAAIARELEQHGLILRGGFHPRAEDAVPPLPDGSPTGTLLLVGNAGSGIWPVFAASPEASDVLPDAMNRWSERILSPLASRLHGAALYPFGGPPYQPFVAWAKRAEPVSESPLGLLIHPDYGLWHAYRGALSLRERLDLPPPDTRPRPCDTCVARPCLHSCPVGAFTAQGYAVEACAGHLAKPEGSDCLELGCRARRACPVGTAHPYEPAQAEFHMQAFVRSRMEI